MRARTWIVVFVAVGSWPAVAMSGDGILEINQVCAGGAGCFVGDDPGFPVQITASGSYKLTSSLSRVMLSGQTVDGAFIEITASHVTLDMAGFQISCAPFGIVGVTECSGDADGVLSLSGRDNVLVRNGTIRGMPGSGLFISGDGVVDQVRAIDNVLTGIHINSGLVIQSVARGNRNGISISVEGIIDGCFARDSSVYDVRGSEFLGDPNSGIRNSAYGTIDLLQDLGGNMQL